LQQLSYDVGDKLGFVEATIEYALRRGDVSEDLKNYLRALGQKIEFEDKYLA
jgi:UTP--glucose-1-phosphate uridylyltransferase